MFGLPRPRPDRQSVEVTVSTSAQQSTPAPPNKWPFSPKVLHHHLTPGVVLSAVGAGLSIAASTLLPGVSPLMIALVIGAVASNVAIAVPRTQRSMSIMAPGTRAVASHILRVGVVLLGLRLSLPTVLALGWRGLVVVASTLAVTFVVTLHVGRRLHLGDADRLLVATGFAVCGAAAVSAMSGALPQRLTRNPAGTKAHPAGTDAHTARTSDDAAIAHPASAEATLNESVAVAVALVTILGLILVPILPWLANLFGLTAHQSGLWIGSSMPEVAHVVMAGDLAKSGALEVATVAKLARVALLAPLVAIISVVISRRNRNEQLADVANFERSGRRPPIVPLFVLGFIGCVALRSTGVLPQSFLNLADTATTALFTAAMFALGWGVDLKRIWASAKPAALLGVIAATLAVSVSGVLVVAVG